jgi:hypothetical protein
MKRGEIGRNLLYAPIASTENRDDILEKQTDLTKTQLAEVEVTTDTIDPLDATPTRTNALLDDLMKAEEDFDEMNLDDCTVPLNNTTSNSNHLLLEPQSTLLYKSWESLNHDAW